VLQDVVGRALERGCPAVWVDRARHFFYTRFINYRSVVIRIDALFEAALGTALLAGGFGAGDFPHPVGRVVVVAAGVLLLGVAAFLWFAGAGMRELALANLATAMAAVAWRLAADGFSSAGSAFLVVAAAGLAALCAAEVATLRA
jgi:hypothetical protein